MDSTAVIGKRIGAYVIDLVIAGIVAIIAFVIFADSLDTPFDPCGIDEAPTLCVYTDGTVFFAEGGDAAAIVLISIGTWLLINWVISAAAGGSPGKLMVGLRVVAQDTGELAGWGKNLVRTLLWVVDSQPLGLPLVGLITGLVSTGHRRVGDMVAKTYVVDKGSVGTPPVVPGSTTPPVGASEFPAAPGGFSPPPPGGPVAPPVDASAPLGDAIAPPAGFAAPPEGTPPMPEATPATPEPDGISAPKWDPDRNAYIQWDPELNAWMEFDDASQSWKPISQ